MATLERCRWCHDRDCPGCDDGEAPQLDGDADEDGEEYEPETNHDQSVYLDRVAEALEKRGHP